MNVLIFMDYDWRAIMNTKTMEGLVGAKTNMDLLNTPFRVFKEARRRGDTATMERAMGYVNEFSDKADEYSAIADKGMKEDAEAAREKAELDREKAIQKRKEEREKLEEKLEENTAEKEETDTVKISEEGKELQIKHSATDIIEPDSIDPVNTISANPKADKEPVLYTKTGILSPSAQYKNISVSI